MSNNVPSYSFKYSVKYQTGNSQMQAQSRPRVLVIVSVPDDNVVEMEYFDHRGILFHIPGTCNLPLFGDIDREEIVLGGLRSEMPEFSIPDFAFNRICDPDTNKKGLELAQRIIVDNKIPVLNHPEKVLATRRDAIYQRFANYPGIVVPKTIRITPKYSRDVRELFERGEISLPCIFRPAGGHKSRGVFLIKDPSDVNELECYAFDGRDYYISEFYDCRDSDGLYRKFRAIYVDGKIYPRHLFVSDDWCVDGKTKYTEEKYFNEERYFMDNFQTYLGEEVMSRLNGFCATIGLDLFGLDLNLRPDGTLVLFEANSCMSVFHKPKRDYLEPYVENIRMATREMLLRFYQTLSNKDVRGTW